MRAGALINVCSSRAVKGCSGGDGGNEGISRESGEIVEKGPEGVDREAVVASAGGLCGSQRTRRWREMDSNHRSPDRERVIPL
jgi:hypothetical protein